MIRHNVLDQSQTHQYTRTGAKGHRQLRVSNANALCVPLGPTTVPFLGPFPSVSDPAGSSALSPSLLLRVMIFSGGQ